MKKLILIIFTLILLSGCATNHWTTISDLSKKGDCTDTSCGKSMEFSDGTQFFFGSSPVDGSIGVLILVPRYMQSGVAVRKKGRKFCDPQLVIVNKYGIFAKDCTMEDAEKVVKKIMEMYKERSDKVNEKQKSN